MEIKTAEFVTSMDQYREKPPITLPQLAVVGKSNVGKSSLINSLCNRRKLCKTSATPGKTRLINVFLINGSFHLVDLPGYGFAKRSPEEKAKWSALTDGYFTKNPNLSLIRLVIQLVDSRIGTTEDDRTMLSYLASSGLPFLIVATKSDKLNATERRAAEERLRNDPSIPSDAPILFSSSQKGEGKAELWKQIALSAGLKL